MLTTEYLSSFRKNVATFESRSKLDGNKILDAIQKIKSINPPAYDTFEVSNYLKARQITLQELLKNYIIFMMTQRYSRLDPAILKLKRYIRNKDNNVLTHNNLFLDDVCLEKPEKDTHIELPLFVETPLSENGDEVEHRVCDFTYPASATSYGGKGEVRITLPPLPTEIKLARNRALSYVYSVCSTVYDNFITSDLITNANPEFVALWIPKEEHFNFKIIVEPKPIDPALVLKYRDEMYLIDTWQIKEEKPFEHYLKEFGI